MNIEKIEKLLGTLAKKGDKETLRLVSDLLIEISSFEKKIESSTMKNEDVQENEVNETVVMDKYSHAATILDGLSDSPYDRLPSRVNYNSGNTSVQMPVNNDILNHADLLI